MARFAQVLLAIMLALAGTRVAAQPTTPSVQSPSAGVQTAWRLLDYIAVDYREAVRDGRVVNAAEYQEMVEFSDSVGTRLAALPANPARAELIGDAAALKRSIAAKAEPPAIAAAARHLAAALLAAYPVPLAPARIPDLGARRRALCGQLRVVPRRQGGGAERRLCQARSSANRFCRPRPGP